MLIIYLLIQKPWAAGGEEAQAAMQEIMAALSQVEDEQERYVLGQTLMGTMWEDLGEDAVNALMNTQGEISTTTDALEEMAAIQHTDLGSQLEGLKRKIETEIIVPVTKKYMPQIEKAIDYVSEHLDEIVEHAKPVAAAIATAFAVKKITNFCTSAVNTAKTVKTAFQMLNKSNPLGWIAVGLGTLAALESTLRNVSKKHQEYLQSITDKAAELPEELQKSIDTTKELSDSWKSMQETMDSEGNMEFFDYQSAEKAKESLMALINADGTIKEGQEEKVQSLIDQLNQYGDTGLTVSDGIITKNDEVVGSYNEISGAIDAVIQKQHAQNLMEIAESGYKEALENRRELLDNETDYAEKVKETEEKIRNTETALNKLAKNHVLGTFADGSIEWDAAVGKQAEELEASLKGYKDALGEVKTAREDNNRLLESSLSYESRYLQMQEDFTNGDFDKVAEGYAKFSSDFITASTGTREELKNQVSDFKQQYENLLEISKESPGLVTDEQLQQAKYLWEQAMIEFETATGEHADNSGKTFLDTLAASGMSQDEKLDALNRYIEERLDNGDDLKEIAEKIGVDYSDGFVAGINNPQNIWNVKKAVAALGEAAETHLRISIDSHSPSKLSKEIGGDWDEGFVLGIEKGIPDVSAISSDMANAAVSSTIGIMHAQGASSIAPYNPIFTQAYSAPQQDSTPTATPSSNPQQTTGDIIIPISIGEETIETVVVNAVTRANASSGGWSV